MNGIQPPIKIRPDVENSLSAPRRTCGICIEAVSKYTCPRCNVFYCSVNCFKSSKHAGCSESFYKDCFMEEMNSNQVSKEDKIKVMKMIKNFEESDMEEEEEQSLESRLQGINLDDTETVWKNLTSQEQNDFLKTIGNGNLVTEWEPWWHSHDSALIAEIDVSMKTKQTASVMPNMFLNVPELSTLTHGKEPSPLVSNNVLEVLYLYAYCCRKDNGHIAEFPAEAACDIICFSSFLSKGITRTSAEEAIHCALESCLERHMDITNNHELIEACMDLYHILLGPDRDNLISYATAAIAQSHSFCKILKSHRKTFGIDANTINSAAKKLDANTINSAAKKLEFLYAWVESNKLKMLPLAMNVLSIYKAKSRFAEEHRETKSLMEDVRVNVSAESLIEELT